MTHSPDQAGAANPGGDPTLPRMYDVLTTMNDDAAGAEYAPVQPVPTEIAVERFGTKNFVSVAPSVQQLLTRPEDRWHPVTFTTEDYSYMPNAATSVTTEADALRELDDFLTTYQQAYADIIPHPDAIMAVRAGEIQQQLTFIGEREYSEAVAGLAALWRSYLAEDPQRLLFVPYRPIDGTKGRTELLLESVLQHIPEDDPLRARIRSGQHTGEAVGYQYFMVILLDHWADGSSYISDLHNSFEQPTAWYDVEVNLLAASEQQLQHGLERYDGLSRGTTRSVLRTRAYYNGGRDTGGPISAGPLITGARHLGGSNFSDRLRYMVQDLRQKRPDSEVNPPALLRIRPPATEV